MVSKHHNKGTERNNIIHVHVIHDVFSKNKVVQKRVYTAIWKNRKRRKNPRILNKKRLAMFMKWCGKHISETFINTEIHIPPFHLKNSSRHVVDVLICQKMQMGYRRICEFSELGEMPDDAPPPNPNSS